MSAQSSHTQLTLPPGQFGLPVIGETLSFFRDPDFAQKRHKKYGTIFKTRLFGKPTIFIKGADANRFVLTNENRYFRVSWPSSTRQLLGSLSLALQTGGTHQTRRKLLAQAFMPRALEGYIQTIDAITHTYCQRWVSQKELTWYPDLRNYTFDVAAKLLIGLDNGAQTSLGHDFDVYCQGLFSIPLNLPWTPFGKAMRSRRQLIAKIEALIRDRQHQPDLGSDTLGLLLQACDADGQALSIEELNDQILLLLFAGHETLTSAIASFCLLTAQNPDVLEHLRDEQHQFDSAASLSLDRLKQMTYLEQVLREVLRLIPPVGGGFRDVLETCEWSGYSIPKGWTVLYSISQTHQDEGLYPSPDKFIPNRVQMSGAESVAAESEAASSSISYAQKYGYVPFGGGIRECLGKEFARLEMKIFAIALIRGYHWTLEEFQDLRLVTIPTPHPRDNLRVQFTMRNS